MENKKKIKNLFADYTLILFCKGGNCECASAKYNLILILIQYLYGIITVHILVGMRTALAASPKLGFRYPLIF